MIEFSTPIADIGDPSDDELMVHLIDPPAPPPTATQMMALPSPLSTLEAYHCAERLYRYVLERDRNPRSEAIHRQLRSLADDSRELLQFLGDIMQSKFKFNKDDL